VGGVKIGLSATCGVKTSLKVKRQCHLRLSGATMQVMKTRIPVMMVTLLMLSLISVGTASAARSYPEATELYIVDDAGVLSEDEENALHQISDELVGDWETVIEVVVIESTDNYESDNNTSTLLSDYTVELFDRWQVGDQEWKDGMLLILATNQSGSWEWWFETGLWWENYGDFWDDGATADDKLDAGNWSDGLTIILEDLVHTADTFWTENPDADPSWIASDTGSDEGDSESVEFDPIGGLMCLFFFVVVAIVIVLVIRSGGGGGGGGWRGGWRRSGWYDPYYDDHHHHHHHHHHGGHSGGHSGGSKSSGSSSSGRSGGRSSGGGASRRSSSGGSRSSGGRSGGRRGGGRRGR